MAADLDEPGAALVGMALHEAKRAARERVLAERARVPPAQREEADAAIARGIASLPSFAAARCVLLTLPFRGEWDTRPLVHAALAGGKTVVLPRVDAATRMLVLHAVADLAVDVEPGYAGIPEPRLDRLVVPPHAIDWALVPGVAFDEHGRRLGYGGGFYDRLLPLLPEGAARVCGAYDLQIMERVPAAPHDLAIGTIVTETRTIAIA